MADEDKIDRVLTHLDSLHTKIDSMSTRQDAIEEEHKKDRADAAEWKARADAWRKDAEEKEKADKARKDAEEKERADKLRADAEAKEKEEKEKEEKEKADKVRKDAEEKERADQARSDSAVKEQVELPKFVEIQQRIDEVAQAFGDSSGAPRWLAGESLGDYTRRLLSKYKPYSKTWKDKDLAQVHDSVLDVATAAIRDDAMEAAALPETVEGRLSSRETRDKYGRTITKFYGDSRVAYAPFSFNGLIRKVKLTPINELRRHS